MQLSGKGPQDPSTKVHMKADGFSIQMDFYLLFTSGL